MKTYQIILHTPKSAKELKNNIYFQNIVASKKAQDLLSDIANSFATDSKNDLKNKLIDKIDNFIDLDNPNNSKVNREITKSSNAFSFKTAIGDSLDASLMTLKSLNNFGHVSKTNPKYISCKKDIDKVKATKNMFQLVTAYNASRDYRHYHFLVVDYYGFADGPRLFNLNDLKWYKKYVIRALMYYSWGRLYINTHKLSVDALAKKYSLNKSEATQLKQHRNHLNPNLEDNYHKSLIKMSEQHELLKMNPSDKPKPSVPSDDEDLKEIKADLCASATGVIVGGIIIVILTCIM